MGASGVLSLAAVAGVAVALATNRVAVETAMLAGLMAQILLGAVGPAEGLSGFSHPAVISIGALFVVAAGLRETGATLSIGPLLLGRPKSVASAQFRLMAPVAILSGFINNTPVVAMYLPLVREWAGRIRVSASKLLLPLSFASILGGQLTVIGSASNLILMGLYLTHLQESGLPAPGKTLTFWGPALLGLPAGIVGIAFLIALSKLLIPERLPVEGDAADTQKYTVHMELRPNSRAAGRTIDEAGLRSLPGLFLFQIERAGTLLAAPPPDTRLMAGDRLSFTGVLESVVDLQRIRGLVPTQILDDGPVADPSQRELVEAVIATGSPLVGRTVREARFRTVYNAAVVAVRRNGVAIESKIGDIRLQPGDTLLLETPRGFARAHRSSSHFYLVSPLHEFVPPRHDRLGAAAAAFGLLVAGLMLSPLEPVTVCMCAGLLMICSGCVRLGRAISGESLQIIVAIAAALGMAAALEQTGAARSVAAWLLDTCTSAGIGHRGILFVMMLTATLFAQMITKNGAAALMFPVAKATADSLGLHLEPFAFSLIFGCGMSFLSPVGYQTNLMVYGPGGYRFLDFARVGLPLTVLLAAMGALLCPLAFPFKPLP